MHTVYVKLCLNQPPHSDQRSLLLFAHSLSGCDTVSLIYNGMGKVNIFKELYSDKSPHAAINSLRQLRCRSETITNAGIVIFQYLYGDVNSSLVDQRYRAYIQDGCKR